jgi:hypothetical protein
MLWLDRALCILFAFTAFFYLQFCFVMETNEQIFHQMHFLIFKLTQPHKQRQTIGAKVHKDCYYGNAKEISLYIFFLFSRQHPISFDGEI